MPKRPEMPSHDFTPEKIDQFRSIIHTGLGLTAEPNLRSNDAEIILTRLVRDAMKRSTPSKQLHETLLTHPESTINKRVDQFRAELLETDRRQILRKPPSTYAITTAQPSHIQHHAYRYGLKPPNNGRS